MPRLSHPLLHRRESSGLADLDRVRVWAHALIRMHLDPAVWSFGFDRAKRRAGLCNYTDKRITVSRYLAEKYTDDEVYQILLHEVAHAVAGSRAAHGPRWLRIARDLGYIGGRTHDGEIAHEHAPWHGTCPAGHHHYRFRRPTSRQSCGTCSRRFSAAHLITWRSRQD